MITGILLDRGNVSIVKCGARLSSTLSTSSSTSLSLPCFRLRLPVLLDEEDDEEEEEEVLGKFNSDVGRPPLIAARSYASAASSAVSNVPRD